MTTTERYVCTIEVPGLPPSPNDRLHHMARARLNKRFRGWVALQARAYAHTHGGPIERARVRFTLVRSNGKARDATNAASCIKPVEDGLTIQGGGGLLVDDDNEHIVIEVCQETGRQKCVRIEVWEIITDGNDDETTDDRVGRGQAG